jgi:hypothetical protein
MVSGLNPGFTPVSFHCSLRRQMKWYCDLVITLPVDRIDDFQQTRRLLKSYLSFHLDPKTAVPLVPTDEDVLVSIA